MAYGKENWGNGKRAQGAENGDSRSLWKSMPMWVKLLIGIGIGLGGTGVGIGLFGGGDAVYSGAWRTNSLVRGVRNERESSC